MSRRVTKHPAGEVRRKQLPSASGANTTGHVRTRTTQDTRSFHQPSHSHTAQHTDKHVLLLVPNPLPSHSGLTHKSQKF